VHKVLQKRFSSSSCLRIERVSAVGAVRALLEY